MRLIGADVVTRYLTRDMAFDTMRGAFEMEGRGEVAGSARMGLTHAGGRVRVLGAAIDGLGLFGHKVIAVTGGSVRFTITLFDAETGATRAIIDGDAISSFRTAATTAVATDILASPTVEVAAIIGTGAVAASHLVALHKVRPASLVRVFSPNPDSRRRFVAHHQDRLSGEMIPVDSVEQAVAGASLVTLATKAVREVFHLRHLRDGMHMNSVGAVRPGLREVAPEVFDAVDRVVCDSVDLVFGHCGDAIAATAAGYRPDDARDLATEMSDLAERAIGATSLFKSAGTAVQDVALAAVVFCAAEADDAGFEVPDPVEPRPVIGP